jgi:hypothetical protein
MRIVEFDHTPLPSEVEQAWARLAVDGLFFVPSYAELQNRLRSGCRFRLLAAVTESKIESMACFIFEDGIKYYHIGGTKLFHLPVRLASLFGSCVVGQTTKDIVCAFFGCIISRGDFDLVDVGYSFLDSPLYKALADLENARVWQVARKKLLWWLIRLPNSFEEYIDALPETTRRHVRRDCRRFDRQAPAFRVLHRPEEVDSFLADAAAISRLTYQWRLKYGLQHDEDTHRRLRRLAENGALRCYISYIGNKPCAFGWGELNHGKFYFEQTGFDPSFHKFSPGTALIMRIIKDMIENTDCRLFHFQWGSEEGYKSRLSTESHMCTSLQVAQKRRLYPALIAVLDRALNAAKNSVGFIVERSPLKARMRGILRRQGVGTF